MPIAAILYEDTPPEHLSSLEIIEQIVRQRQRIKLAQYKNPPLRK